MRKSLVVAALAGSSLIALPAAHAQSGAAGSTASATVPMGAAANATRLRLAGPWTGTLRAGPIAATLHLDFALAADGRMGAARAVPDGPQPALEGDIREVVVSDTSVAFSVATPMGTLRFSGAPDAQGTLKGQLTVIGDGGHVEARGVWTAATKPCPPVR